MTRGEGTAKLGIVTSAAPALIERLGDPHRRVRAYEQLLEMGPAAEEAAIVGLSNADPGVRMQCCRVLDHLASAAAFEALVGKLDDQEPAVRIQAVHALACDRCKRGACRPDVTAVLPAAIRILRTDPDPHVRAYAAELVGIWVHSRQEALEALTVSQQDDPVPAVRKKASWYAPGGVRWGKTRPTAKGRPTPDR